MPKIAFIGAGNMASAIVTGLLSQRVASPADLALLGELRPQLEQTQALNLRMQQLFRDWHAREPGHNARRLLDQCALPWFVELNRGLHDPLDDAQLRARLRDNMSLLQRLAMAIAAHADSGASTPQSALLSPLFAGVT